MVEASWLLWEADSFPKSVTHSLNASYGNSEAFIMRDLTSTGSHSGSNWLEEGGMGTSLFLAFDCL